MNQLVVASLSHTHYWYEVGMLKVPAVYLHDTTARVLTSGHPPETINRVLTYGYLPGLLKQLFRNKSARR